MGKIIVLVLLLVSMLLTGCASMEGEPYQLFAYYDEVHDVVIVSRPTSSGGLDAIPARELTSVDSDLFWDDPYHIFYYFDKECGLCIWVGPTSSGGVAVLPSNKVSNPQLGME